MTRENVAAAEPEKADASGEVEDVEAKTEAEAEGEAEDDPRDSANPDPLRAYLRAMTSFSLLTREGEIKIAKSIEDGHRRVLQIVVGYSVGIDALLSLGD